MKLRISKDWIKKFDPKEKCDGETIPIVPPMDKATLNKIEERNHKILKRD